jgi:hypothetical protein
MRIVCLLTLLSLLLLTITAFAQKKADKRKTPGRRRIATPRSTTGFSRNRKIDTH